MNNFIEWIESLWNAIISTNTMDTTQTQPTTTPIQPQIPLEVTTEPVSVVYNPTPVNTTTSPTKLDLWCKAAIEMEGANPANNNPGNIRYVMGTWMQKMAIGENNGFCVFKDYETGYAVLKQFFTNAATGKSSIYHPTDTLYVFYSKYAPASDNNNPNHYAEFVAGIIGVSPTVEISTLV